MIVGPQLVTYCSARSVVILLVSSDVINADWSFDSSVAHSMQEFYPSGVAVRSGAEEVFENMGTPVWCSLPDRRALGMVGLKTRFLWLLAIILVAAQSAIVMRRYLRWAQESFSPLCSTCGYSLRGNESGICPECGVPGDGLRDSVDDSSCASTSDGPECARPSH